MLGERLALRLTGGRSRQLVCFSDLITLLVFPALFLIALFTPRRVWPAIARGLARPHVWLRPPDLDATADTLCAQGLDVTARGLAIEILTFTYLDNIEAMTEYLRFRGVGQVEMVGVEHLQAALARGRGAIIWKTQSACSGVAAIRNYPAAGLAVTTLRSYAHPLSASWLGLRFLNPIRSRAEDRSLAGAVMLEPGGGRAAREQLEALLRQNRIVSMAPIGATRDPIAVPFLGGTLRIARGAPSLALKTGAPVVAMTAAVKPGPIYVAEFDPAIWPSDDLGADPHRAMVDIYATRLAEKLRREPGRWKSWVMRHTWSPTPPNSMSSSKEGSEG